ncbi:hypothetical protein HDU93_001140 [Gonapodya sp. JEL0774]|nr:hypothetical protein HDU93_001140 [Gonapodya sp. JEL0774]
MEVLEFVLSKLGLEKMELASMLRSRETRFGKTPIEMAREFYLGQGVAPEVVLVYGIQGISLADPLTPSTKTNSTSLSTLFSLIHPLRAYVVLIAMLLLRFTLWNPWRDSSPPGFLAPVAAHCAAFGTVWVAYRGAWMISEIKARAYANFDAICGFLLVIPPSTPTLAVAEVGETYFKVRWSRSTVTAPAFTGGGKIASSQETSIDDAPMRYIVEVNGHAIGETKAGETAVRVQKLEPGKLYKVRVWAVGSSNLRTASKSLSVRTAVPGAERPIWERERDALLSQPWRGDSDSTQNQLVTRPPSRTEEPATDKPLSQATLPLSKSTEISGVSPTHSNPPPSVGPAGFAAGTSFDPHDATTHPSQRISTPPANPADATIATLVAEIDSVRQSRMEIEVMSQEWDAQFSREEEELRAELGRLREGRKVEEGGRAKVRQRLRELEGSRREVETQKLKMEREIQAALEEAERSTLRADDLRTEAKRLREHGKSAEDTSKRAREQLDSRRKDLEATCEEERRRTVELKEVLERRVGEIGAVALRVQEIRLRLKSLQEENRVAQGGEMKTGGISKGGVPAPGPARTARQSPHKTRGGSTGTSKRHGKSLSMDFAGVGGPGHSRDHGVGEVDVQRVSMQRPPSPSRDTLHVTSTRTRKRVTSAEGKDLAPLGGDDRHGVYDEVTSTGAGNGREQNVVDLYAGEYADELYYGSDHVQTVDAFPQRDPNSGYPALHEYYYGHAGSDSQLPSAHGSGGDSVYADYRGGYAHERSSLWIPSPQQQQQQHGRLQHYASGGEVEDDFDFALAQQDLGYGSNGVAVPDSYYNASHHYHNESELDKTPAPPAFSILETIPGLSSVWAAPTPAAPVVHSSSGRFSPSGWDGPGGGGGLVSGLGMSVGTVVGSGVVGVQGPSSGPGGGAVRAVGGSRLAKEEERTWTLDWGTTVTGAKG